MTKKKQIRRYHSTARVQQTLEAVRSARRILTIQEFDKVLHVIQHPPKAEIDDYMREVVKDARRIKVVS